MTEKDRIEKILCIMEDIEKSHLSVSKYFKEMTVPFGPTQYYHYKKTIEERGIGGLIDQRNIAIERNTKQENLMKKLEFAFDCINSLGIKDIYGNRYNFRFLRFNPL
jgi:hypothetical protein